MNKIVAPFVAPLFATLLLANTAMAAEPTSSQPMADGMAMKQPMKPAVKAQMKKASMKKEATHKDGMKDGMAAMPAKEAMNDMPEAPMAKDTMAKDKMAKPMR